MTVSLALIGMGLSWAAAPPRQPLPVPPQSGFAVTAFTASPSINFSLTDPDTNPAGGTGTTTVTWTATSGTGTRTWILYVYANFASCSANYGGNLKVSCTGGTSSRPPSTNTCTSGTQVVQPVTSAPGTQLASGRVGVPSTAFSDTLQYTLADSWAYVAGPSCALNLTYTLQGQ